MFFNTLRHFFCLLAPPFIQSTDLDNCRRGSPSSASSSSARATRPRTPAGSRWRTGSSATCRSSTSTTRVRLIRLLCINIRLIDYSKSFNNRFTQRSTVPDFFVVRPYPYIWQFFYHIYGHIPYIRPYTKYLVAYHIYGFRTILWRAKFCRRGCLYLVTWPESARTREDSTFSVEFCFWG